MRHLVVSVLFGLGLGALAYLGLAIGHRGGSLTAPIALAAGVLGALAAGASSVLGTAPRGTRRAAVNSLLRRSDAVADLEDAVDHDAKGL